MHIFNIPLIIGTVGIVGVSLIVFAESGLFFGFFLPGDSLLFTAGLLVSQGYGNLYLYLGLCFAAAVLGDNVGYFTGRKMGPRLFRKEDSLIFKKKYLAQTQDFYKKYGKKALVMARFIPIVRTFAPILAGAGEMEYRKFFMFNVIGGLLWTWMLLLAGFFLGTYVPSSEKYLGLIIVVIILVSFVPPAIEFFRSRGRKNK